MTQHCDAGLWQGATHSNKISVHLISSLSVQADTSIMKTIENIIMSFVIIFYDVWDKDVWDKDVWDTDIMCWDSKSIFPEFHANHSQ